MDRYGWCRPIVPVSIYGKYVEYRLISLKFEDYSKI